MPEVDLEDLFADGEVLETEPEAESLDDAEEVGPDDEFSEDSEDESLDDDAGELTDEGDDEAGDEAVDDEADPEADEESEAGETETEADERDSTIARLEALVLRQQQEFQRLAREREAAATQQKPAAPDPQMEAALFAVLYGGTPESQKEALGRLPPHVVQQAREKGVKDARDQVRYILDPAAFYNERVLPYVEEHIRFATQDLRRRQVDRSAREAVAKYEGVLSTQKDRREAWEILQKIRNAKSDEELLGTAVELLQARRDKTVVKKTKEKLSSKERDLESRKSARRRAGGRKRRRGGKPRSPELEGFDLVSYARKIQQSGAVDDDTDDLLGLH